MDDGIQKWWVIILGIQIDEMSQLQTENISQYSLLNEVLLLSSNITMT
jgi:hypothetical protein